MYIILLYFISNVQIIHKLCGNFSETRQKYAIYSNIYLVSCMLNYIVIQCFPNLSGIFNEFGY